MQEDVIQMLYNSRSFWGKL